MASEPRDPVRALPHDLVRVLWELLPVEACALSGRVSHVWRAALTATGHPLEAYLRVGYFVGSPALLTWARAQARPFPWDFGACAAIAKAGKLGTLEWARTQTPPCPWDWRACSAAAEGGHLAVLQWARAQTPPCLWDESTCAVAARGGHLAVLQWARAQTPPCPWNESVCNEAAAGGFLDI